MPARVAGVCGLLAFVTFNVGWIAGGLAQPSAYAANIVFSAWGDGAATRAGTVVVFLWVAFVSAWLLRTSMRGAAPTAPEPDSA
jgi:hypothetical protein